MNIAIFSDNFYPELGGIQDSILALGRELGRRGHKVNFYVPSASRRDFAVANLPAGEIYLGENVSVCRYYSLPYKSPTKQSRMVLPTALRWLKLKKFRPDIIHTQTFFGVGLDALVAAKALRVPLVGTDHWAITEFSHYSPVSRKAFKKYSLKFVSWYFNRCNFVSAPSESVLAEIRKSGFGKPSAVISNPIDTAVFTPLAGEKSELKKKFNLSHKTIVFASRLASEKKIEVLIKAAAILKQKIPDVNLVLAGHGSHRVNLERLAASLGVKDNVKFLGTLAKPDLADLYRAADLFAIASTSETQSMTMLQAMASGLPVVGVRDRCLPEYINEKNGLLVEPDNPQDMAEKAAFLLENNQIRENLGRGAAKFAQKFSTQTVAQTWIESYQKVAAEAAAARAPLGFKFFGKMLLVAAKVIVALLFGTSAGVLAYNYTHPGSVKAFVNNSIAPDHPFLVERVNYITNKLDPDSGQAVGR